MENEEVKHKFIYDVVSKLIHHLDKSNNRHEKIVNFLPPDKLEKAMDFSLPDSGDPLDVICGHVDKILQYAMKTGAAMYTFDFVRTSARDNNFKKISFVILGLT